VMSGPTLADRPDILDEVKGRAAVYQGLLEVLQRDGVQAAINEYKGPGLEALGSLATWDGAATERTYYNDGWNAKTKTVDASMPNLHQEIRKHFKSQK